MAQIYVKFKARPDIPFPPDDPTSPESTVDWIETHWEVPDNLILASLEFGYVDNTPERKRQPLLVTPFYFHDDAKTLHTICRRGSAEIDEVEW